MSQQTREYLLPLADLNSDETWLEGTIKIKNSKESLVQFFPETTYSYVIDALTGKNLHETLSSLDSTLTGVENTGNLAIMKEEPDSINTQFLPNETLIAWYAQPSQEGVKHLSVVVTKNTSNLMVVQNTVGFIYYIINDGENYSYENISITNPITGTTHQIPVLENDPFKTVKITETYTIKESDVLAALANEGNLDPANLTVSCSGSSGVISVDFADNFLNVWKSNLVAERYNPFITVTVNSSTYGQILEGETINYYATISNITGTSISNLSVTSSLSNAVQTISLEPWESTTINYSHNATSSEMFAGKMSDTITATGTSFASTSINVAETINYQLKANATLQVEYVDLATGKRSIECTSGDSVSYKATISNFGTVTLYSITMQDAASGATRTIASLAPGAYAEYEFTATFNSSETMEIVSCTISAKDARNNDAAVFINPLRCYVDIPAGWSFKVAVDSNTGNTTAIPFNLFGQSPVTLYVNWGDGSTSTLTSSHYTSSSSTASMHTYSSAGEYTVSVDSSDWENTFICSYDTSYSNNSYFENAGPCSTGQPTANRYACVGYFRLTVSEILSPIPALAGTNMYSSYQYTYIKLYNMIGNPFECCSKLTSIPSNLFAYLGNITKFNYCFYGCTSLASIPAGLFSGNRVATSFNFCFTECITITSIPAGLFSGIATATSFNECFSGCTSLASIPADLFSGTTAATSFNECFSGCTSLASIPADLFSGNAAAIDFSWCFSGCTSLTAIPSGLFDNCTTVTNFNGIFSNCSSLASIPSGLFNNNVKVTNFTSCFNQCTNLGNFTIHIGSSIVSSCDAFVSLKSGATRTVYVPANSTTYTRFDSLASSLELTIIGE